MRRGTRAGLLYEEGLRYAYWVTVRLNLVRAELVRLAADDAAFDCLAKARQEIIEDVADLAGATVSETRGWEDQIQDWIRADQEPPTPAHTVPTKPLPPEEGGPSCLIV